MNAMGGCDMERKTCQIARELKDKNYDGKFYFGVKTTGIFCRPSCPAPLAKEENVIYFDTVFEAINEGFRPCLRCRPDLQVEYAVQNVDGSLLVNDALKWIYEGFLFEHSIKELAETLYISDRQLRKLFIEHIGVSPVKVAKVHKALFARKLLQNSDLSITRVATASGFGSIRQFNQVFQEVFGRTPTMARRGMDLLDEGQGPRLLLPYQTPFDFAGMLSFFRARAIVGIELIDEKSYQRTFRIGEMEGILSITDRPEASALEVQVICEDIRVLMAIYGRVRRMFDLDVNLQAISDRLGKDAVLQRGMKDGVPPWLPVAFDPFEHTIRAVLGQQITVKAATTLAGRLAARAGMKTIGYPEGLDYFFPRPEELTGVALDGLGITNTRQQTVKNVAAALLEGVFHLRSNQSLDQFRKEFSSVKGIGEWTVQYVAMRGLGMVDSFPAKDLGIIKALMTGQEKPKEKEILKRAESWSPYRAYAAICLWNSNMKSQGE
jgi:AraC family transcriptional regulator of adaptative response / DNA-3-methyladenine glycosylase II